MRFSDHDKEIVKEFVLWLYNKYKIFELGEDDNLDEILKEYFDKKEIAAIKHACSSDLFERLNEIDDKMQAFDISAYKYDLLYKEQSKIKIELQERGYSVN